MCTENRLQGRFLTKNSGKSWSLIPQNFEINPYSQNKTKFELAYGPYEWLLDDKYIKYKVVFFDFFLTGESFDDDRKSSRYAHFCAEKSI